MKTIFAIGFLALASSLTHAQLAGSWSLGTNRFTTREKHQAICHDSGELVVMAGRSANAVMESDTWRGTPGGLNSEEAYDWSPAHTSPSVVGREAFTLNYAGGEYWIFGGRTETVDGAELFYSLVGSVWAPVTLTTADKPEGRYRHRSATLDNGNFVVMFGQGLTSYLQDVWMFTPTANATGFWTQLHNGTGTAPGARFDPCCAYRSATDSIVCFGGTILTGDMNDVWEFSIATSSWTEHTTTGTSPSARRLATCGFRGDSLTVWSGYSSGISNNTAGAYIHELPLATLAWANHAQTNGPISRDGAAVCGNSTHQYLLGGLGIDRVIRNDIWQMVSTTAGALSWVEVSAQLALPAARSEHATVMIGSSMVVGFGKNNHGKLQDVWKYDTQEGVWAQLATACPYGARSGAGAVTRGDQVWFVGGELDDGSLTMDIVSFDIGSLAWTQFSTTDTPPGRHRVAAATFESTQLVVVGGTTATQSQTSEIWIYVPQTQQWYPVEQTGDGPLPERRSAGLVVNPSNGQLVVLGGTGAEVLLDRWTIDISTVYGSGVYQAALTSLASTVGTAGLEPRSFRRSEAAVVGSGNHFMVCGGAISDAFPVIDQDSCYQYDTVNYTNIRMGEMPVNNYFSTGVYFGNSMYVFGGNYILNGIKQNHIYLATMQQFNFTTPCATDAANDDDCVHCSSGTAGSSCSVVPAGTFKSVNSTGGALLCSAGQFAPSVASQSGLFCQPCPEGTYQSLEGQSSCDVCPEDQRCPVGATAPLASTDLVASADYESHPPRHENTGVSAGAYLATLISWVVLVLLILIFACIENKVKNGKAGYYMTDEQVAVSKTVYDDVLKHELGLRVEREKDREIADDDDEELFIKKCNTFRGLTESQVHTALIMFATQGMHLSNAEAESIVTEDVVDMMLDPFEEFGVQFLSYRQFLRLVCSMFEEMQFKSDPETGHYTDTRSRDQSTGKTIVTPGNSKGKSGIPNLEAIDLYPTGHQMFKMGESLMTMQTRMGGIASMLSWVTVLALVVLLILLFGYDNVEETMAVLPDIVVRTQVVTTFSVEVQISGSSVAEECVVSGTDNQCYSESSATASSNLVVGSHSTSCAFTAPRYCKMTYTCVGCRFGNSSSQFEFIFGHPDSYSVENTVTMTIDSGIVADFTYSKDGTMQQSSVSRVFTPTEAGGIFKGYPESVVALSALPTTFVSPRTVMGVKNIDTAGYHISDDNTADAVLGNQISVDNFRLSRSVPVVVTVRPETNFLVVTRFLKKDLVGLLSAILGVVSGLGAATLAVIQMYDTKVRIINLDLEGKKEKDEEKKKANKKEDGGEEPEEDERTLKDILSECFPLPEDKSGNTAIIDRLIAAGLRRQAAKIIVELARPPKALAPRKEDAPQAPQKNAI